MSDQPATSARQSLADRIEPCRPSLFPSSLAGELTATGFVGVKVRAARAGRRKLVVVKGAKASI